MEGGGIINTPIREKKDLVECANKELNVIVTFTSLERLMKLFKSH
jgi:hypothetical protein